MTAYLACVHHRDRPGTRYDTYADEVCRDVDFPEKTPYEMEFVLSHIPDDIPPHWPARPTVEVNEHEEY
jgi:hypothetical protein